MEGPFLTENDMEGFFFNRYNITSEQEENKTEDYKSVTEDQEDDDIFGISKTTSSMDSEEKSESKDDVFLSPEEDIEETEETIESKLEAVIFSDESIINESNEFRVCYMNNFYYGSENKAFEHFSTYYRTSLQGESPLKTTTLKGTFFVPKNIGNNVIIDYKTTVDIVSYSFKFGNVNLDATFERLSEGIVTLQLEDAEISGYVDFEMVLCNYE
jgi:hypothetical protein